MFIPINTDPSGSYKVVRVGEMYGVELNGKLISSSIDSMYLGAEFWMVETLHNKGQWYRKPYLFGDSHIERIEKELNKKPNIFLRIIKTLKSR